MKAKHRLLFPFLLLLAAASLQSQEISEKEKVRRELNAKYDTLHMREKTDFVVDRSADFLIAPKEKPAVGEFVTAKTPPTVHFRIFPDLVPEYFSDGPQYMVCWANWGHVTRSEDNRFFFAASDHRGFGANINLYEYSPARNLLHKVLDVDNLLGWIPGSYSDGKIHGYMGIMPDGTLWGATHYGAVPDSSWFENGYRGSWLFSYNINSHEAKNWGIPLLNNSLPCYNFDLKRGRMVATGEYHQMLVWDCIEKKVRYAGFPPHGWTWFQRAMLCDEDTGKFWGLDWDGKWADTKSTFLSFDPEFNRFERFDVTPPKNPANQRIGLLRGHTDRPAMDGWYYWSTLDWETNRGAFFRFKPSGPDGKPLVDLLGTTWDEGRDVLQMALDPSGRYIYYCPKNYPAPVVQYDVKLHRKKVLCWLQDFYFEKYGYWPDECYGLSISKDGSFLVAVMNGEFQGRGVYFGHPSLFVIDIPKEERPIE